MEHFFTAEAAVPLRAEPREGAEMVSQLLFGDFANLEEAGNGWLRVRNHTDGYQGWASANMLTPVSAAAFHLARAPRRFVTRPGAFIQDPAGALVPLPLGASIPGGFPEFELDGSLWRMPDPEDLGLFEPGQVSEVAHLFFGTPYLWGGRCSFGIDCSGLTQTVYRYCGIPLSRDSGVQIREGEPVSFSNRREGDLAFFAKPDQERVSHVGIVLNENRILHASGRVRIDTLSPEGIIHPSAGLTHRFLQINRYFGPH